MKKKVTVLLSEEAFEKAEHFTKLASENFDTGKIIISDIVNEMILTAEIDIRSVQNKCVNIKKSILKFAKQENPDLDQLIKSLQELKGKSPKKTTKGREQEEKLA
jgi:hypothetical protein